MSTVLDRTKMFTTENILFMESTQLYYLVSALHCLDFLKLFDVHHFETLLFYFITMFSTIQTDGDLVSEMAIRSNAAVLEYTRTSVSALSGGTAGILGLTGLYGFAFYFIFSLIMSVSFGHWYQHLKCCLIRTFIYLNYLAIKRKKQHYRLVENFIGILR